MLCTPGSTSWPPPRSRQPREPQPMYGDKNEHWPPLDPVDALHVSVSLTILANNGDQLQVLMQENHEGPYSGYFVLPNLILTDDKTIEEAAHDLCASFELAGMKLEQIAAF